MIPWPNNINQFNGDNIMVITKNDKQKSFNFRIPHDIWYFMRKLSLDTGLSMNTMLIDAVTTYKKKMEKRIEKQLTDA